MSMLCSLAVCCLWQGAFRQGAVLGITVLSCCSQPRSSQQFAPRANPSVCGLLRQGSLCRTLLACGHQLAIHLDQVSWCRNSTGRLQGGKRASTGTWHASDNLYLHIYCLAKDCAQGAGRRSAHPYWQRWMPSTATYNNILIALASTAVAQLKTGTCRPILALASACFSYSLMHVCHAVHVRPSA
ncbi:hypothetical protein COO60DRAFT_491319 [Scenedesmus sp. NREL 46B-D3]|nr:hypothetical protein COO60DRAFT_491319 [Scenedesmus sp. NREL 46B-D3]